MTVPGGAYNVIREAAPRQRIGFVLDGGHELCQVFVNGLLTRPREGLASDVIEAVNTMFETETAARAAVVGS